MWKSDVGDSTHEEQISCSGAWVAIQLHWMVRHAFPQQERKLFHGHFTISPSCLHIQHCGHHARLPLLLWHAPEKGSQRTTGEPLLNFELFDPLGLFRVQGLSRNRGLSNELDGLPRSYRGSSLRCVDSLKASLLVVCLRGSLGTCCQVFEGALNALFAVHGVRRPFFADSGMASY